MSRYSSSIHPRLTINVVQPLRLKTECPASDFPLELFSDGNLHLPSAEPVYKLISISKWYIGLPITIVATVYNDKPQSIFVPTIHFKINDKVGVIEDSESQKRLVLDPQETFVYKVTITPQRLSPLEVHCTLKYQMDNVPNVAKKKIMLEIFPSVNLKCRSFPSPKNILSVSLQNMLPFTLFDTVISTDAGDTHKIGKPLDPMDVYSCTINVTRPYTTVIATFNTKNYRNISFAIPFQMQKANIQSIVKCELKNVPNEWPMLKPFKITLVTKNTSTQNISGKILVAELNDSIFVHGNNDLCFSDFKPNEEREFSIEFVAVKQGTYKFPVFDFYIENMTTFRVNNEEGIIVVGHNDDEK